MKYYIADTHFSEDQIIKLCHRPFVNVQEMDIIMVKNWNEKVKPEDEVFIVGDFADTKDGAKIAKLLNGIKILIVGNHDEKWLNDETKKYFCEVTPTKEIIDEGRVVVLSHYPMASYKNSIYGAHHVYGHTHNNTYDVANKLMNEVDFAYNAGVDVNNFMPSTLDELIRRKYGDFGMDE